MADPRRFSYLATQNTQGESTLRPLLPIVLHYGGQSTQATGLLDTGADVDVLPFRLGIALGATGKTRQRLFSYPAIWQIMRRVVFCCTVKLKDLNLCNCTIYPLRMTSRLCMPRAAVVTRASAKMYKLMPCSSGVTVSHVSSCQIGSASCATIFAYGRAN